VPVRRQVARRRPRTEQATRPVGAKNAVQKAKGKVKNTVGKVTGNERLEAEGKADQSGANIKKAGENVKDAFED